MDFKTVVEYLVIGLPMLWIFATLCLRVAPVEIAAESHSMLVPIGTDGTGRTSWVVVERRYNGLCYRFLVRDDLGRIRQRIVPVRRSVYMRHNSLFDKEAIYSEYAVRTVETYRIANFRLTITLPPSFSVSTLKIPEGGMQYT